MTKTTGSWLWMAPEVLAGSRYSEKADVYSFALVLWEMVERRLPWDEVDSWNIQKVVVQKKVLSPFSLSPSLIYLLSHSLFLLTFFFL
jgi:serine/threonine protein kinase